VQGILEPNLDPEQGTWRPASNPNMRNAEGRSCARRAGLSRPYPPCEVAWTRSGRPASNRYPGSHYALSWFGAAQSSLGAQTSKAAPRAGAHESTQSQILRLDFRRSGSHQQRQELSPNSRKAPSAGGPERNTAVETWTACNVRSAGMRQNYEFCGHFATPCSKVRFPPRLIAILLSI
jgi:hypothetical protein